MRMQFLNHSKPDCCVEMQSSCADAVHAPLFEIALILVHTLKNLTVAGGLACNFPLDNIAPVFYAAVEKTSNFLSRDGDFSKPNLLAALGRPRKFFIQRN